MSRARDLADRVLHNRTHEDTDGGRESILTFKGEQSGGEISTLAQIQASHDGTSDDEKSDLIFKTNDGSDGTSPTERLRIDSGGHVGINKTNPDTPLDVVAATGEQVVGRFAASNNSSSANNGGAILKLQNTDNTNGNQSTLVFADSTDSSIGGVFGYNTNHSNASGYITVGTRDSGTFAERIRVDHHGLKFNGDTAEANALSDYEYGTFSPTYTTSAGDASGVTYTAYNTGSYVKIGNVVHFQFQLSINGMTSAGTGSPRFGGLPFNTSGSAPLNEATRYPVSTYIVDYVTSSTAGYIIQAYFPTSGVNYLQILLTQDAYAWAVLSTSQFLLSAGDYVSIMGTYFAD